MSYVVIKPIKQEERYICVTIAKCDFSTPHYRQVFETEQELYICRDREEIIYWLMYPANLGFDKEKAENLLPEEFDVFSFEFDYETRDCRVITEQK